MGIHERDYYRDDTIDLQPTWNNRSAVSTLIIINAVIFVANVLLSDFKTRNDPGVINSYLMLSSEHALDPLQWWHCLTYAFAHSGAFHLIFNMLGLYFLGRSVEEKYGKREFLTIYLLCAVFCGILWLLKHKFLYETPHMARVVGASGAVICIEMLFVFNYPTQIVTFFIFPMPAWVLGVLLVMINLANQPDNRVAVDVHLMGIAFAALYFFAGLNFTRLLDVVGTWKSLKRKLFGPKLRVHKEESSEELDAFEADRILGKIHEKGQDSLTSKERKFLERYSRRVRERKNSM